MSGGFRNSSSYDLTALSNPFSDFDPYGLSPFWDWKTLETENFRISFPEHLKPIALRSAKYFEETHAFLSEVLRWEPRDKTQVLVIDNEDMANGLTSAFAKFGMILWSTPPDTWYSIGYYDDWLRMLVVHEYTHFLNLDASHGIWTPIRNIFGSLFLPNMFWPAWMLEGLAVYMETRFTQAGRGRSPYYDMILRAAVEQGSFDTPDFVTLDRINGANPYFPWGDTRYIFGYYLMAQLARSSPLGAPQENVLGELSEQSSFRIPFFINTTLESVAGKTWYELWKNWVDETRPKIQEQLTLLRSEPLSRVKYLTASPRMNSQEVLGAAPSPNGEWIAYTMSSSDRRQGLYLQNLRNGEVSRVIDKLHGVSMSFTPDSKAIIYSRIHQENPYNVFSDLEIYCIEDKTSHWLTEDLRAKDPDLSPDGQWLTFTVANLGATELARARILPSTASNGNSPCPVRLGPTERLIQLDTYDRIATPRFSKDGEKIYFSLHTNGKAQEDIVEFDLQNRTSRTLVSDGYFNRLPTVHPSGDLFYVSNATGVDNLYRLARTESKSFQPMRVTHLTTGINTPVFSSGSPASPPRLYASVFSDTGWNLAELEYSSTPFKSTPIPLISAHWADPIKNSPTSPPNPESQNKEPPDYPIQNYSALPTLAPRVWSPIIGYDTKGVVIGGQLYGFDATNRHRYAASATYGTQIQLPDLSLIYSNRTLGPTLNFHGNLTTQYLRSTLPNFEYAREASFAVSMAYPWFWTYSSLKPAISFNFQKFDFFTRPQNAPSGSSPMRTQSLNIIPSIDLNLTYSSLETSHLAISPEAGRLTQLGLRYYLTPEGTPSWKVFFSDQENIRLSPHTVLVPSLKGSWSSLAAFHYHPTQIMLQGRSLQGWLNTFGGDSLDSMSIRGYPGQLLATRSAIITALDLRFPLGRIFRGWGTNPLFFENLYGFTFLEGSFLPRGMLLPTSPQPIGLASVGAGIRLSTEIFFLPFIFSLEYQEGLRREFGGTSDLFFQVLGNLSF